MAQTAAARNNAGVAEDAHRELVAKIPTRSESAERNNFTYKVRKFLPLIKAMHHVKNVSDNKVPKQIQRMTQLLITMIKPAALDDGIRDSIYGSANGFDPL